MQRLQRSFTCVACPPGAPGAGSRFEHAQHLATMRDTAFYPRHCAYTISSMQNFDTAYMHMDTVHGAHITVHQATCGFWAAEGVRGVASVYMAREQRYMT